MTAAPLLLVESDPDAARAMGRVLGEAEFAVHCVRTAEEGLQYLAGNAVAAIVLDDRLPLTECCELVVRLRERHVESPVIVTSREGEVERVVKVMRAGAFDFVEKRDDFLAGLAGKVREAVASRQAGAAVSHVVRPVFVGRETELRVLDEQLDRALGGAGRTVLVMGEEGIGKTSLALETTRLARERGCAVLWGQCHETGGAPAYWPWIQILRRYVATAALDVLREDLDDGAAAVGWIVPTLRDRCPDLPTGEAGELTRFHVVDGVTQFLKRIATRRALVLVLDDLHRADGDSLHLLRFFASESADAAVVVVGACRDGGAHGPLAPELARIAAQPRTTLLRLGGFDVGDVHHYVEAATAVRPPEALAQAIHAKTEGHPLFVAEVTRLLAAEGSLGEDPSRGDFRVGIPATRRQAITDRLAHLSTRCLSLLRVAAVIGYEFGSELLAVAGEEPATVRVVLDEAIREQLVTASDDEPGTHRFTHVLIRDALYESLPPADRRTLHARIAEALATARPPVGSPQCAAELPLAAIAHHALEAVGDPAGLTRALEWVVAAGDRAAGLLAYEEAARHYGLALELGERASGGTAPSALLMKLADARWHAGDIRGARDVARRALALAKETGQAERIGAAALTFAGRLPGFGAVVSDPEVIGELEHALALLERRAPALRAQVMARLAEELACSPHRCVERSLGQRAIDLARRVGEPTVLAAVLRTTQWSVWTPGDVERRRHLAAEIVALAARTHDRALALEGELLHLWSALEHGETGVAWHQLDLCARLATDLRLPHYAWVTAAARVCLHVATGRLDEAQRLADHAAALGERAGHLQVTLFVGVQRALVRLLRGGIGEVADWLASVLEHFPVVAPAVECAFVVTYARAGQHERAREALARFAADDFARVPRNAAWLVNMTSLAAACTTVGDAPVARQLYPHLAPFTPYNVVLPPALVTAPVAHHAGGLAALMDEPGTARRHYEEALALEERTGSRQWIAITQIAYGRVLLCAGRPADARRAHQLIRSGRAIAAELGLTPIVHEADAALAAAPRREPVRGAFRRVGDGWEIEFRGARERVPHRIGMTYLQCLLERPGVPIPAIELASLGRNAILVDHGGERAVDFKAMVAVQRRIAEIDGEILACERRGAVVGAELQRERDECVAYLAGRGTELRSAADRARSGVTKAIGRAITAIGRAHEALGCHLDRHIETGRLCVYVPDAAAPVTFET